MKFIFSLALLVTLSVSALAQATGGQIGSTAPRDGQIGSTRYNSSEPCVLADGQIGSTKSTPEGDLCVARDGQIGSTRSSGSAGGSLAGLLDGLDIFGIKAFFARF